MKRHLHTTLLLATGCIGLFSCRTDDEWQEPSQKRACLSVDEARAAYDRTCEQTRSTEGEIGVLYPGETNVYWDGAAYSENSYAASFDVPIWTEQGFQIIRSENGCGNFDYLIFPKLVVVSKREAPETATPYLAFYFADPDPARDEEPIAGEGLLNSLPKADFSGRIVYTELTGLPVAAARYIEGRQIERAFLYDACDSLSFAAIADRYNRIVGDIRVHLYIPDMSTRSSKGQENDEKKAEENKGPIDGGPIPTVVVTCKPISFPVYMPTIDWLNVRPDPSLGTQPGGGGGDRESNGPSRDGSYPNTKLRTDSEIVDRMLDSIYQDCMGKTLIDNLRYTITITTDGVDPGYNHSYTDYENEENKISFGDANKQGRTYVLLEELIHSYQHQNDSPENNNCRLLNYEIEAKIGWLLYEKRNRPDFKINNYKKQLGGITGAAYFNHIISNYPSKDFDSYSICYEGIIDIFRHSNTPYSSAEKYPEDSTYWKYDNIIELSINCYKY